MNFSIIIMPFVLLIAHLDNLWADEAVLGNVIQTFSNCAFQRYQCSPSRTSYHQAEGVRLKFIATYSHRGQLLKILNVFSLI